MKKTLLIAFLATFLAISLTLALTACSSAPVQEMSDARQAITAAKKVGAEKHSPSVYSKARQQLLAAENALRNGHYPQARKNALRAKKQAVRARSLSISIGAIR